MRTTIKDIAKVLDLSPSTVSRALRDCSSVSKKTREKILHIAQSMGYQPNLTARGLVSGRTQNIGVILSIETRDYNSLQIFNSIVVNGIFEVADAANYNLTFAKESKKHQTGALQRIIENRDADGVLIVNVVSEDVLAKLTINNIPVVLIDNHFDNLQSYAVNNNDRLGAYLGTKHLLSLGYKSIGFIGISEQAFNRECEMGYFQALLESEIRTDPNFLAKGNGDLGSGYDAMMKLLKINRPPRGVFIVNDEMAIGAIKAIKDFGLSVPGDIAVVGMDGMPFMEYFDPPLTTVKIEVAELGRTALQMLLGLIEGNYNGNRQIAISPRLVIRKSCGYFLNSTVT
jgi:DNA-binding LacI/PurR family transcriptional regulator